MTDETPAAKRARYASPIITLFVGFSAEALYIPECTIKASSPFFKAVLNAKWKEGQTREISLPEDRVDVVATYLDWLDGNEVPLYFEGVIRKKPDYLLLSRIYVFAEKVQDDAFADSVISAIIRGMDWRDGLTAYTPASAAIRCIYEVTCEGSKARQCMVNMLADRGRETWSLEKYDPEFLVDLAREFMKRRGKSDLRPRYESRRQWFKQAGNADGEE